MDESSALKTIQALANGVDPGTGELLSADTILQDPQVIRALFTAIDALKARIKTHARKASLPPRAGQPWTPEESDQLLSRFNENPDIPRLARLHERTPRAIQSQLIKLGKIPPPNPDDVNTIEDATK
jgi:hypothetical protein